MNTETQSAKTPENVTWPKVADDAIFWVCMAVIVGAWLMLACIEANRKLKKEK